MNERLRYGLTYPLVLAIWLYRSAWIEVGYAVESLGYWLRPYDQLADARRWRWVPWTCCRCGRPAWRWTHPRRVIGDVQS